MSLVTELRLTSTSPVTKIGGQTVATILTKETVRVTTVSSGIKGEQGEPGNLYREVVIYREITSGEIIAKEFDLPSIPVFPDQVEIIPIGGLQQHLNVDYYMDGQTVKWDGLALETLLVAGSILIVRYQMEN